MIIIKIVLTLISFYLLFKSIRYLRFHFTPLALAISISAVLLLGLTWFDEITSFQSFQQYSVFQYINLNFVLIAVLIILITIFMWIRNQSRLRNIESEITKIVRSKAIEDKIENQSK